MAFAKDPISIEQMMCEFMVEETKYSISVTTGFFEYLLINIIHKSSFFLLIFLYFERLRLTLNALEASFLLIVKQLQIWQVYECISRFFLNFCLIIIYKEILGI